MLHGGHLWRGHRGRSPQNGSAGHTAISLRPALTQVKVMLMICFNPTKIRVGNIKAFKEKKNLVLPLTQAIFLQIFEVQRHHVLILLFQTRKSPLLYLITLLF